MTKNKEILHMKFPLLFQTKLNSGDITFPNDTQYHYTNITAYRCIERIASDTSPVTRNDFKSYFELNKHPKGKRFRGQSNEFYADYYGVSLFTEKTQLANVMKLPKPNKKLCVGDVHSDGGPQLTNVNNAHICWWLFEDAILNGFSIEEEHNYV